MSPCSTWKSLWPALDTLPDPPVGRAPQRGPRGMVPSSSDSLGTPWSLCDHVADGLTRESLVWLHTGPGAGRHQG